MKHLELIKACKQNSYEAQMQVYDLYKDMLFNVSVRILNNDSDAQDVVHDVFIKAFKGIQKIHDDSNLGAWLKRIAINNSLDILRKRKKIDWSDLVEEIPEQIDNFEVNKLQIDHIVSAINELRDKYRVIVVLYLIEGYSHKAIAKELNLNESTVRNQYQRGRNQLIGILNKVKVL